MSQTMDPTLSPDWLADVNQEIEALLALPENWNSYNARSVRREAALSAQHLIQETVRADTPRPIVMPTPVGGIQIEWHTRGVDLEIEIDERGRIEALWGVPEEGIEEEIEVTGAELSAVCALIARLSTRP